MAGRDDTRQRAMRDCPHGQHAAHLQAHHGRPALVNRDLTRAICCRQPPGEQLGHINISPEPPIKGHQGQRVPRGPAATAERHQVQASHHRHVIHVRQQGNRVEIAAQAGEIRRRRAGQRLWRPSGNAGRHCLSATPPRPRPAQHPPRQPPAQPAPPSPATGHAARGRQEKGRPASDHPPRQRPPTSPTMGPRVGAGGEIPPEWCPDNGQDGSWQTTLCYHHPVYACMPTGRSPSQYATT